MRKYIFLLVATFTCNGFNNKSTAQVIDSAIEITAIDKDRILVINSFDAMSIEARKGKKELFKELTDSLASYLANKIRHQTNYEPMIIPGIIQLDDSLIFSLLRKQRAEKAIVIRSLEVLFEETGERQTEDSDGKPRITTTYDLCARNEYAIYNNIEKLKGSEIENCEYFTSRSVKDSHFTIRFGPDIVGKKKHSFGIVEKNAGQYLALMDPILRDE